MFTAFLGLIKMCEFPLESMMSSGALWFTDLTVADPYCILPLLASGTILTIIHVSSFFQLYNSMSKIL